MNWLRKHKNIILIATIAGFVTSTFVGFGLYMVFGSAGGGIVLEVNAEKIPYSRYTTLYNRIVDSRRDSGQELTPEILNQLKNEVIQSLVRESVFVQEAKRYGIHVSDNELAQSLAQIPAFQKDGKFDIQTYAQSLRFALRMTPEEFEETQRRQIMVARLQAFVRGRIIIANKELEQDYLLSRKLPSGSLPSKILKDFEEDKAGFKTKLLEEKGAHVLNRWYQQLGTNLQVKNHLAKIEQRGGR